MVRDGDADEERSDPVLDDDSPGPLAELLFSSPVNGAFSGPEEEQNDFGGNGHTGNGTFGHHSGGNGQQDDGYTEEQLLRPFEGLNGSNGSNGRTDADAIAPPVFPGVDGGAPETDLSTVHTPGNADDFADELAALFLPLEPDGPVKPEAARPTIAGQAVDRAAETGVVPKEDRPVRKSTLHADIEADEVAPAALTASAPIVAVAPVQPAPTEETGQSDQRAPVRIEPVNPASPTATGQLGAAATTSMGAPAVGLQYSTEANPAPQALQWSTVVHEPSHPGGAVAQQLHDQALFEGGQQGMGGPLRFEATSAGTVPRPQAGGRLSDTFLAATERRWFWGAVAGAVTLSCLVVAAAFIGFRDTDNSVDTDAALATVDSDGNTGANQQQAGQSGTDQESAASAQLTPTSLQVQVPNPAAPAVRPPTPTTEAPAPTDPATPPEDPTTTEPEEESTTPTTEPEEEETTTSTTEPEEETTTSTTEPEEETTTSTTEPEEETTTSTTEPEEETTTSTTEPEEESTTTTTTEPEEETTTTTTVAEDPVVPGPDDPPGQTP